MRKAVADQLQRNNKAMTTSSKPSIDAKHQMEGSVASKKGRKQRKETSNANTVGANTSSRSSFLSSLAVFGDSVWALVLSFALLAIAIGVALYLDNDATTLDPVEEAYAKLPPTPRIAPPKIYKVSLGEGPLVTKQMQIAFENDGVIAVRGLLTQEQIDMLVTASDQIVPAVQNPEERNRKRGRSERQFHTVQSGAIFLETPDTENATMAGFREVALFSKVPKMAAELLELGSNETMRMLRDIFLAKDREQFVCGFHVDDTGFWPCTAEAPGVNAWIAIDDMPTYAGGGFALAVGSHKASWRQEAHEAIGSTMTNPPDGYKDAADLFQSRVGEGTCNLKRAVPHIHRRMEETKRIYEVRRGDVIFTDRWLFHRTVPFNRGVLEKREAAGEPELIFRRYSLRYNPGSARIPKGYGTELSVLWDDANGGRTADEVASKDGPWYPLCYPSPSLSELQQMNSLIRTKIPVAQERYKARKKEMKPFLTELGKRLPASTDGY